METKMQKVVNTEVIMFDRDSKEYKQVMTEYLKIKTDKLGQEEANKDFDAVNTEFTYGSKTIYKFDDGLKRNVIQLNFLSPTITKEGDYSGHIQNWSMIACQDEDDNAILIAELELSILCMHEGGH
jgi:hypothetical protein